MQYLYFSSTTKYKIQTKAPYIMLLSGHNPERSSICSYRSEVISIPGWMVVAMATWDGGQIIPGRRSSCSWKSIKGGFGQ